MLPGMFIRDSLHNTKEFSGLDFASRLGPLYSMRKNKSGQPLNSADGAGLHRTSSDLRFGHAVLWTWP